MFRKVGKKETLSKEIVKQIEQAILKNEYEPGDKIPSENEMCEIFDVSRTAVREAIQKLSARGLIEVKKGSGIYVKEYAEKYVTDAMELYLELNLNKEYLMNVMEIRKLFEPQLARMAAENRTEEDIEKISKTIEELDACDVKDFKKEGELDKKFHSQIADSCGNPLIMTMFKPIFTLMPKIRSLVYKDNKHIKSKAQKYHNEIFAMIKNQDKQKAFEKMQNHLKIAEQDSQKLFSQLESEDIYR